MRSGLSCGSADGCTAASLYCGINGSVVDCSAVGIAGELESLDLSGIPDPPTELTLRGNGITGLSGSFIKGGASLLEIDASWNAITSVASGAFAGTPSVRSVDIQNNTDLTSLPGQTFKVLTELDTLLLDEDLQCNAGARLCSGPWAGV